MRASVRHRGSGGGGGSSAPSNAPPSTHGQAELGDSLDAAALQRLNHFCGVLRDQLRNRGPQRRRRPHVDRVRPRLLLAAQQRPPLLAALGARLELLLVLPVDWQLEARRERAAASLRAAGACDLQPLDWGSGVRRKESCKVATSLERSTEEGERPGACLAGDERALAAAGRSGRPSANKCSGKNSQKVDCKQGVQGSTGLAQLQGPGEQRKSGLEGAGNV